VKDQVTSAQAASCLQLKALARELEQLNGGPLESDRHVSMLLEELIVHSPEKAFDFVTQHLKGNLLPIRGIDLLLQSLAAQLLAGKSLSQADELFRLTEECGRPLDTALICRLAKVYAQEGNAVRAEELLRKAVKERPAHPDALRGLYELMKTQERSAEAHDLLNSLLAADFAPTTIAFAHRERGKLPADGGRPLRVALLSSFVLDQLVPYLDRECRKSKLTPDFYVAPFNQYTQDVLNPTSALYEFKPDMVLLSLAIEDLLPAITGMPSREQLDEAGVEIAERLLTLTHELRRRCGALLVVTEFTLMHRSPHGLLDNRSVNGVARWIEEFNRRVAEEFQKQERVYLLPLTQVLARVGIDNSCNPKMQYMASMRLGEAALPELAKYCMRYIKPLKGLTRKCVVVDLDGTLWGGVVGEVGPEGIHLGPMAPGIEYVEFQKALLNLTRRGILLAICSKNNPEDALPVIRNHVCMVLREEQFAALRINWNNKAENLRAIAEELNIGLDAMVFIDDNPNERELVCQLLPEVLTVDLPTDPSRYRATLEAMTDFELLALTKEDEMRVAQYQALGKRQAMRNTAASLDEYLHSLSIRADVRRAGHEGLARLVQLFNKTNQFNLTTRRYQAAEMEVFLASPRHRVYTLQVSDRFVDHGMVGSAILEEENGCWRIDSLLMSCRVMGLSVETAFLERIYQDATQSGVSTLRGEFIPTRKNRPAESFYGQHGFVLKNCKDEIQCWELMLESAKIEKPAWITMSMADVR